MWSVGHSRRPWAALVLTVTFGCGSTSDTRPAGGGGNVSVVSCSQGQTRACVGPGQCPGGQFCDGAGHWSACDCGTPVDGDGGAVPGAGGSGNGGRPSIGGTTGNGGFSGSGGKATVDLPTSAYAGAVIGRACGADADCGAGYQCIGPDSTLFAGGGQSHGVCVADCSGSASVCGTLDPTSICVSFSNLSGGPAFCMEGCTTGPGASKCHGRPDVACDDYGGSGAGDGYCRPMCRGDYDCAGGKCNYATGTCDSPLTTRGKTPFGAPCDSAATTDDCMGFCVPFSQADSAGFCTGTCTLGEFGCGESPTGTDPLTAACLFDATVSAAGDVGDLGFCGTLCDCDADCPATNHCAALGATQQTSIGRTGYCASPASTLPHLTTCP